MQRDKPENDKKQARRALLHMQAAGRMPTVKLMRCHACKSRRRFWRYGRGPWLCQECGAERG